MEVWGGLIELRQLPVSNPAIDLGGTSAFTWIICWARDGIEYREKVANVLGGYGLFAVNAERVMPFRELQKDRYVSDELLDQYERVSGNQDFVIYGTFHQFDPTKSDS